MLFFQYIKINEFTLYRTFCWNLDEKIQLASSGHSRRNYRGIWVGHQSVCDRNCRPVLDVWRFFRFVKIRFMFVRTLSRFLLFLINHSTYVNKTYHEASTKRKRNRSVSVLWGYEKALTSTENSKEQIDNTNTPRKLRLKRFGDSGTLTLPPTAKAL